MDTETFTYILGKIEHHLIKNWCNLHQQRILPEERLVITLSTAHHRRQIHTYSLELLMMRIEVPETCWAYRKVQ